MAILHVDGDSFFASCEASLNPRLLGLPVVTGQERGIASAISKEAKALGISRGMPIYQVKKNFPQVVVLNSDYGVYEMFAKRMFAIVRRHADEVEEYSIDECFACLSTPDAGGYGGQALEKIAKDIKRELQSELGMTFSLGVAPTKVLAKLASSKNKPDGLTILVPSPEEPFEKSSDVSPARLASQVEACGSKAWPDFSHSSSGSGMPLLHKDFLKDIDIGKVWGIGPATAGELRRSGIATALDLAERPRQWIESNLNKHTREIWHELNGISLYRVSPAGGGEQKSIQATRTFTPPSGEESFIFSELSKNIENACVKARRSELSARKISCFLKTREFRYHRIELPLYTAHSTPAAIVGLVRSVFPSIYKPRTLYRTTGVTLSGLVPANRVQRGFLDDPSIMDKWHRAFQAVDDINRRHGSHSLVLASSLEAYRRKKDTGFYKRLNIPYMGEVN